MIPEKIANACVTDSRTDDQPLLGYLDGTLTISFQKNGKADKETLHKACIEAVNKYFSQS